MDIQLAPTTFKACSGRRLIVNPSRLIQINKITLKNLFRFDFLKLICEAEIDLCSLHVNNYYEVAELINLLLSVRRNNGIILFHP